VLSNLSRSLQASDSREALRPGIQALTEVISLQEQLAAERRRGDAEQQCGDATEQYRKITQAQNDRLRARAEQANIVYHCRRCRPTLRLQAASWP
jgi:hypothetical protein